VLGCLLFKIASRRAVHRAANRADLSSRTLEKSFDEIGSVQLPAILLLHDRQACILVEKNTATRNEYKIILPQSGSGEKVISRDELENFTLAMRFLSVPSIL